jgi:hypothetical protein
VCEILGYSKFTLCDSLKYVGLTASKRILRYTACVCVKNEFFWRTVGFLYKNLVCKYKNKEINKEAKQKSTYTFDHFLVKIISVSVCGQILREVWYDVKQNA